MSIAGVTNSVSAVTAGAASITSGVNALSGLLVATPQSTLGYQPQPSTTATPVQPGIGGVLSSIGNSIANSILGGFNPSPPAIIFNYEGEQTATLESDITDHYVEDNTAVQDQIALKPPIITTQGYIGELNDIPPNAAFAAAAQIANSLVSISGYLPNISTTALIAYNEAVFAYNNAIALVATGVSAASSLGNLISGGGPAGESFTTASGSLTIQPNQNKQQIAFQQFYGYWFNRTLFTIQTPWAVFQNMAIKSLRAIQDAETNVITDFEVTFKQIRYATTSETFDNQFTQSQLFAQSASAVPQPGSTPPAVSSPSITQVATA